MSMKILINAVDKAECRIAIIKASKLESFHIQTAGKEITHGNIYKGIITRVEPSLQAVFVDYGADRNGFLQKQDVHSDYYLEGLTPDRSIKQLVKRGQEVLVQITKDPVGKKGAMLTTFLSLPGRHLVLMPGSESRGVSRKIEDEEERQRLRKIVNELKMPEGFGLIVRTAGFGCTKSVILKDSRYLMRLWKKIKDGVVKAKTPSLMYREQNLVLRSLRDYFTPDVSEILIDDNAVHREVKEFMQVISPKQTKIVKRYKGAKPIFTKYDLERQISSIFENRVELKSGGSIVIEQTEALVAIDVNSGKATKQDSIEKTALQTNLEAAEEVARQLRLRDLGGLIVVDFIDMRDSKNKTNVERTLRAQMKADKAKSKVGRISRFGLLEMSRQRLRPSIEFGSYETCRYCGGKGLTPSTEKLGLSFLRELSLRTLRNNITRVSASVPAAVAEFLLNERRRDLLDIEDQRNVHIDIRTDSDMLPGDSKISCE